MRHYKRWLAMLVCAIMVFTCEPTIFAEEPDTTYEENFIEEELTFVTTFADTEEDACGILSQGGLIQEAIEPVQAGTYDHAHDAEILDALENVQDTLDVSGWGLTTDNFYGIIRQVLNSNPQIFYYNGCSYYMSNTGDITSIVFNYSASRDVILSQKSEIAAEVAKIDAQIDTTGMTDIEIALAYHDYLATDIAYDYANLISGTLPGNVYTIYGTLVNKKAVCQGYAETMQYLLIRKGVVCGIASSGAANHAWNVIQYNGKWYHLDVTWDDPVWDNLGRVGHDFFMISDATLLADDSDKSDYVICVPYGYTYSEATDTTYENGFWDDINTYMYPYQGDWYYIEPIETGKFNLVKYNYTSKLKTDLVGVEDAIWYANNYGSYWTGNYSRMAARNGVIYYSTPNTIERYDIANGAKSKVFTLTKSADDILYIYGLGYVNGKLNYVKRESPNNNQEETYEEVISCTNHSWGPAVEIKATYESEGSITKICNICGEQSITVIPKLVYVSSLTLNKTSLTMSPKETVTLTATCSPTDATDKAVAWTSSDTAVATVDANGKVTAVKAGRATITATAKDGSKKSASCTIAIYGVQATPVAPVVATKTCSSVTLKLVSGCEYSVDGKTWQDSNVFTGLKVDTAYTFYARKKADLTNYMKAGEASSISNVKLSHNYTKTSVVNPTYDAQGYTEHICTWCSASYKDTYVPKLVYVSSVTLNKTSLTMSPKETVTLTATCSPADAANKAVTWTSLDTAVATVDANGKVTAVKAGSATITATAKDGSKKSASCTVTVKDNTTTVTTPAVNVRYTTHVQSYGWQGKENDSSTWFTNGKMAGTSGEAKRLEGIKILVNGNANLGVQYTTHCQSYGWLPWSGNGEMNGTEGEAKRLEAIKIQLTGADKDKYDIYYRVHAQSYGWLGWAMNGAPSGTAGYGKRLEGIQIVVVKKGEDGPGPSYAGVNASTSAHANESYIYKEGTSPVLGSTATTASNPVIPGSDKTNVTYRTHVQTYGWQGWKFNGQMSGTSGEAKRLEGINIRLTNQQYTGDIVYTTHVQTYGWQGDEKNQSTWKKNGQMSGTSGEAKRLEAIRINLTGEMAAHYDIYYRVHAQTYGWLGWAKNGEPAGTAGYAKRLEGIQIVIVNKGAGKPSNNYGNIASIRDAAYVAK